MSTFASPLNSGFGAVLAAVAAQERPASQFKDEVRVLVLRQLTVEGLDTYLKHHLFARQQNNVLVIMISFPAFLANAKLFVYGPYL